MGIIGSYVMWTLPPKKGEHQAENVSGCAFNHRRSAPQVEATSVVCRFLVQLDWFGQTGKFRVSFQSSGLNDFPGYL